MQPLRTVTRAVLLLGLVASQAACQQPGPASPAPRGADAPLDLTPRHVAGERLEVDARLDLSLSIRLVCAVASIDRTSEQQQVVVRRYRDALTEVKDGKVATVERQFLEAWDGLRLPGAPALEREASPLHQRRIVVGLDDAGRRRVRPAPGDGPLPEESLEDELHTERWEAVRPAAPVAVGATGRVEGDRLRRALGKGLGARPEGKIECRLLEVRQVALDEGAPPEAYAVVEVEVNAAGPQGDEADAPRFRADLRGEVLVSLARRQVAKVDLRGEARLRQTRRDGEAVVEVDGRGTLTIEKRTWWPVRPARDRAPGEGLPSPGPSPGPGPGAPPGDDGLPPPPRGR